MIFALPFTGLIHGLVHLVVLHHPRHHRIAALGFDLLRVDLHRRNAFRGLHRIDIERRMVLVHDIANHGGHDPGEVNHHKAHQGQHQRRLGNLEQRHHDHGRALLQQKQEKAQQKIRLANTEDRGQQFKRINGGAEAIGIDQHHPGGRDEKSHNQIGNNAQSHAAAGQKTHKQAKDKQHPEKLPGQPFPLFLRMAGPEIRAMGNAARSQRRNLEGVTADRQHQAQTHCKNADDSKYQSIAAGRQQQGIKQRLCLQWKQKEAIEFLPERRNLPL